MPATLGLDAKIYRNTGTVAVPIFNLIENVKDVTLSLEKALADVTTRAAQGFRQEIGTLKEVEVTFQMVWDGTDDDFTAIKDAFFDGTQIHFAVMDGDVDTTGKQGLQAFFIVSAFTRNEPLEDAITVDVTLRLALPDNAADQPLWVIVP